MFLSRVQFTGKKKIYGRVVVPKKAKKAVWINEAKGIKKEYSVFMARTKKNYKYPFTHAPKEFKAKSILWLKAIPPLVERSKKLDEAWLVKLDKDEYIAIPMSKNAKKTAKNLVRAEKEEIEKLQRIFGEFMFTETITRTVGMKEEVQIHSFKIQDEVKPEFHKEN